MNSKDVNITDTTLIQQLTQTIKTGNKLNGKGETSDEIKDSLRLKQGILLRYYPESDKALVHLNGGGNVRCVMLHQYMDNSIGASVVPMGNVVYDTNYYENYIEPFDTPTVMVLDIEHGSNNKEYAVVGFVNNDTSVLGENPDIGSLNLKVGDVSIRVANDTVSINNAHIYIDGMPLKEPVFDNIYEKGDVDKEISNLSSNMDSKGEDINSKIENLANRVSTLEENQKNAAKLVDNGTNSILNNDEGTILTHNLNNNYTTVLSSPSTIKCTLTNKSYQPLEDVDVNYQIVKSSNLQSRTYTIKTNTDGKSELPINLAPGEYSIRIYTSSTSTGDLKIKIE